jgi:hypothetical protein
MFLNSSRSVWHPDALIIDAMSSANAEPAALYHKKKELPAG